MIKPALALISLLALAGCSTSQLSPEQADPVPPDRLYGFSQKTASDDSSIQIVRDDGIYGSGCGLLVRLDGKRAAMLNAGEVTSIYAAPGEHVVTVGLSGQGLCAFMVDQSVEMVTKPNEKRVYRLSLDQNGFYINRYVGRD